MTDPTSYEPRASASLSMSETAQVDAGDQADLDRAPDRATSAVVARGTLLLSLLSRQAAAARAEAQCAELRILLGEAKAGKSLRLQRWLRIHAAEYPTECSPTYPSAEDCSPAEDNWRSASPSASAGTTISHSGAANGADEMPRRDFWVPLMGRLARGKPAAERRAILATGRGNIGGR